MNIARTIEICAAAIDAAYAQARAIQYPDKFATEAPFVPPDRVRTRLEWANNKSDAVGFVYEMRTRASELVPLNTIERFALEYAFELLRVRILAEAIDESVIEIARAQTAEFASKRRKK